jgi:hypothetical protein
MTRASLYEARKHAAARRRRIVLNNDGNEPVYLIKEPTKEEILAYRTAPLPGTQVDTVLYCTWSSGFGIFTHFTEVGQVFTCTEGLFATNKMSELLDVGVDPLQVMNEFYHNHDIEFFWSMRMNDVHDGHPGTDYGPIMFACNQLKADHPEWMIGVEGDRPRYGSWSAMDYGVDEVRDFAFCYIEEVCKNYDVDGVEMDFFRHPVFFRDPARGFAASQSELDMMSSLVRRVREMMDEVGADRGRPILSIVRAPDSVAYCRAIGLDIERWFADDLVDIYVPSGYVRLSPWQESVSLARHYGVMVYPAMDESRVKEAGTADVGTGVFTTPRGCDETYRARAAEVLASGADGVYLYNFFNPNSPILDQLGESDTLRGTAKNYFCSYLGVGQIAGTGYPHEQFITIPTLNPHRPLTVYPGLTEGVDIGVYEDDTKTLEKATVGLRLTLLIGDKTDVFISLGGVQLEAPVEDGKDLVCSVNVSLLCFGENRIDVRNTGTDEIVISDVRIEVRFGE